jgi:hypothetical protein
LGKSKRYLDHLTSLLPKCKLFKVGELTTLRHLSACERAVCKNKTLTVFVKHIFTCLNCVVVHEDLVRAAHSSLYTVVVEVKGGVMANAGIEFTDFDFTIAIYPPDARVAPTVFVSSN